MSEACYRRFLKMLAVGSTQIRGQQDMAIKPAFDRQEADQAQQGLRAAHQAAAGVGARPQGRASAA
jgi:hypothetical protein